MTDRCLFAGLPVEVTHTYAFLRRKSKEYKTELQPLFHIDIGPEEIRKYKDETKHFSDAYWESIAFFSAFCERALDYGVFVLHSSALMVDGKAYLFAAPSGTGKSTHARLWRELLGDRVTMINDDKPFLRREEGGFRVYGSPWNGKHNLGENISAPLAGLCFLRQGKENRIAALSFAQALPLLLPQVLLPDSQEAVRRLMDLLGPLLKTTPLWQMDCTISPESAKLSYQTMTGGSANEAEGQLPRL